MLGGIYHFPEGQLILLGLIFLRIIAFVVAWPIFGTGNVPVPVKILLALVLTVMVFPTVKIDNAAMLAIGDQIIVLAVREILVGLFLGFLMRMFFFSVSVAGEIISLSSGLSASQMYNPALGITSNVMEQFHVMLATLFFLSIDGHHLFLAGLTKSFAIVGVSDFVIKTQSFVMASSVVTDVLLIGVKMAAPVMAAIFLANVALGVLGRAVPQINIFVTSLPIQILLGLGVMILAMPLFINQMDGLLEIMTDRFFAIMRSI